MTLEFYYYFYIMGLPSTIITLYYLIYPILGYYYVIKASSKELKELNSSHLIKRLGIINIIIFVFSHLLPNLVLTEFTQTDYMIYKLYYLFFSLFISATYLYSFGYCLFLFGKLNKLKIKEYLRTAGLFMIISYSFSIISTLINFLFLFDYIYLYHSYSINYLWIISIILDDLSNTLDIVGIFFIIISSIIHKHKNLLISMLILFIGSFGGNILNWII